VFTGLIEEVGILRGVERRADGTVFTVGAATVIEGTRTGDSIAVNGACLTVTAMGKDFFSAFASRVTCEVTTLGSLERGRRLHLERALTPTSRLGGHMVQGHVDGRGTVASVRRDSAGIGLDVETDPGIARYLVPRGSVAVDGVSLTVVSLSENGFGLYLIPETLKNTILGDIAAGHEVNIEIDILAKYVEKMLRRGATEDDRDRSLMEKLMEEGYA